MRRQQKRPPRAVPDAAPRLLRREPLWALPLTQRSFAFESHVPAALRPSEVRGTVALAAACFLVVALLTLQSEALGAILGCAIGAAASIWAASRGTDDRRAWALLALAFTSLAVGRFLSLLVSPRAFAVSSAGFADLGTFGFTICAAMCNVAWPEIRRSSSRSIATLTDTVTIVMATAVWGWAGFPVAGLLPPAATLGLARSADLMLPVITASVAAPQLDLPRRWSPIGLAVGASLLLIAEVLAGPALLGVSTGLAPVIEALGFAVMIFTVLSAAHRPASGYELPDEHGAAPPFAVAGILGVLALILAAVWLPRFGPPMPILLVGLGGCLGLREILKALERRWAGQRLAASLGLEARLLDLQGTVGPTTPPEEVLRLSCALALDVLKADAALAWLVRGNSLVLSAITPEHREGMLGRRLPIGDHSSLAARVLSTGAPEACSMSAPGARSNRFLAMVLHADFALAVPIISEGSSQGVLVLVREEGKSAFTGFDQQKAALIAGQTGASLRRHEMYLELENQLTETTLIHRFVIEAIAARTVSNVGWLMLESIRSHVPYDRAAVYVSDSESRGPLTPVAHYFRSHDPVAGDAGDDGGIATLTVSLLYGSAVTGKVDLHRSDQQPFAEHEEQLTRALAQQAAVAIQNIRLREESGKVATYRELDRLKTELVASVSHDLRGPLTSIKFAASSLIDQEEDLTFDSALENLRDIEAEADRLKDLLEHLLDLSKIEAGALRIDLQPVALPRIVQELMASLQSPKFTFECAVPENLYVMADGRRLRQVLANLLENAVKYSPEGGMIRVTASERQSEVVVSVSDEGVGIPRSQWDRVFRAYQRADTGTALGVSGTGLGLAICKGIVEAHGGRIWVDDREEALGTGTTFSFTVPRAAIEGDNVVLAGLGASSRMTP